MDTPQDFEIITRDLPTHLRVYRLLGKGGFAEVYLATYTAADGQKRDVAVKYRTSGDSDSLKRFAREISELKRLTENGCESVVQFIEADTSPQPRWYVMDYCSGGTLASQLSQSKAVEEKVRIILELAKALADVHLRGVAHRDITPSNVLLSSKGKWVLSDFGLLRNEHQSIAHIQSTAFGTPCYGSPEQRAGLLKDNNFAPHTLSDVYSFGAVCYHLFLGVAPEDKTYERSYDIDSRKLILRHPNSEHKMPSFEDFSIEPDLEQILIRCLRIDPRCRFQSMGDVVIALERKLRNEDLSSDVIEWLGVDPKEAKSDVFRDHRNAARYLFRKVYSCDKLKLAWIEWILVAAAENGVFNIREVRQDNKTEIYHAMYAISKTSEPRLIPDLLVKHGIFSRDFSNDEAYSLRSIDADVLPALRVFKRSGELTPLEFAFRNSLKHLAKNKATEHGWEFDESKGEAATPQRIKLPFDTLDVIVNARESDEKHLRIISEYGTWLRRQSKDAVISFLQAGGRITIILAEPPPIGSEGFIEWAESVYFLLHLRGITALDGVNHRVKIFVMDRRSHEVHLNLGNSLAIIIRRVKTEYTMKAELRTDAESIGRMRELFDDYLQDRSTEALEDWQAANPLLLSGDDFDILALGKFSRNDIIVVRNDSKCERLKDPQIEGFIDRIWDEATELATREGRKLENMGKYRLADFSLSKSGALQIMVGQTNYKEFWGTNKSLEPFSLLECFVNRSDRYWLEDYLANPISVNITLLTNDNKIIVGRRTSHVAEHPGYYHVPGGHIETAEMDCCPFEAVQQEVFEELGITHLSELYCFGLVRPVETWKPELVFGASVNLSSSGVSPANNEHLEFEFIEFGKSEVREFILRNRASCVPTGKASLVAFGNYHFGTEWMIETLDALNAEEVRRGVRPTSSPVSVVDVFGRRKYRRR